MDKENMAYPYCGILFSHKRKEILTHTTTWMDLENITSISQIQRSQMKRGKIQQNRHPLWAALEVLTTGFGLFGAQMWTVCALDESGNTTACWASARMLIIF